MYRKRLKTQVHSCIHWLIILCRHQSSFCLCFLRLGSLHRFVHRKTGWAKETVNRKWRCCSVIAERAAPLQWLMVSLSSQNGRLLCMIKNTARQAPSVLLQEALQKSVLVKRSSVLWGILIVSLFSTCLSMLFSSMCTNSSCNSPAFCKKK